VTSWHLEQNRLPKLPETVTREPRVVNQSHKNRIDGSLVINLDPSEFDNIEVTAEMVETVKLGGDQVVGAHS